MRASPLCLSFAAWTTEKVKNLQGTLTSADPDSQNGLPGVGAPGAAVGRVEAVAAAAVAAAATLPMGDAPAAKQDPLLALARALVRHAKVRAKKRKDTAKWNVSRVHRSIFYRLSNGVAEETEREEKWAWKIVGHITRSACGVLYNVCLRRVLSKYTTTRSWRIGTLAEKDTTTILGRPQVNASSTFMYVLLLGLSESRRCF